MEVTKEQVNTLKDFDLEMFKQGVNVYTLGENTLRYVADNEKGIVVQCLNNDKYNFVVVAKEFLNPCHLKMLPLFFVEDKPVYPGDVLYFKYNEDSGIARADEYQEGDEKHFTWNKPKVKKEAWGNLYRRGVTYWE